MYLYKPYNGSIEENRVSDDIEKIKEYIKKQYNTLKIVFWEGKNPYLKDNNIIIVKCVNEYNEEQCIGNICNVKEIIS